MRTMKKDIKNTTVVVTGGASGIGYQIADKFLRNGAKIVVILDINPTEGSKATTTLNAKHGAGKSTFIKCDVTKDLEEVSKKIFDTYNKVDVLVNNAGIVDEKNIRRIIEINTIAVVEWSMKFFNHMRIDKGGKGGTILNMGSYYSFLVDPFCMFYKSSKYAVMGFSRSLGHEKNYRVYGVRVIVICPGFTATNIDISAASWEEHYKAYEELVKIEGVQQADVVGEAAITAFEKGESGSAWAVKLGEIKELPVQHYQFLENHKCNSEII